MIQEVSHQTLLIVNIEVENLVLYFTDLFENWEVDEDKEKRDIGDLEPTIKLSYEKDSIMILVTKINSVNVTNYNQLVCLTQFNIEKSETYV